MATKQQTIQEFKNRLNRVASQYSEHILSTAQFNSLVDDAIGLFSTVRYTQNSAIIEITSDDPIIPLPLDFLDGFNDELLLALSRGQTPNSYKYVYSNLNFGYIPSQPFYNNSYVGFSSNGLYQYGKQNLSNSIIPTSVVRNRPELTTTTINGITYPAIIANPTPTSDQSLTIYYTAKHQVTDSTLLITFSALPSNTDSFIADGATFTFVSGSPANDYQIQILGTISLTISSLADTLNNLGFIATASGSSITISNATGTTFSYNLTDLNNITSSFTSSLDTISPSDRWAIYNLMQGIGLQGLIAQRLLEDKQIREIQDYCKQLIDDTLLKLNT